MANTTRHTNTQMVANMANGTFLCLAGGERALSAGTFAEDGGAETGGGVTCVETLCQEDAG